MYITFFKRTTSQNVIHKKNKRICNIHTLTNICKFLVHFTPSSPYRIGRMKIVLKLLDNEIGMAIKRIA